MIDSFLLVYFASLDVNHDKVITRDDLEACLPPTVESQQLIQQLLRQWDMVNHPLREISFWINRPFFRVVIEEQGRRCQYGRFRAVHYVQSGPGPNVRRAQRSRTNR